MFLSPHSSPSSAIDIALWLPAIATLVAAFAGTYFAFHLQNIKRKEDLVTKQVAAINRVAVTLGEMQNELLNYKKQILDPNAGKALRAFSMQASPIGSFANLVLHSDSLVFLCETEHKQVPMTVAFTNTQFHRAIAAINDRANHHLTVVQPGMAASVPPATRLTDAIVERALGVDQKRIQESYTDSMYTYVEGAIVDIQICIDALRIAGKALYPKGRTITTRAEN